MRELNINFQENYKKADNFIRDAYNSAEGISEYIKNMEANDSRGSFYVPGWKDDYHKLKRIRWIRNQLAHQVSIDSDICDDDDYRFLCAFYQRLYNGTDPLSTLAGHNAPQKKQRSVRAAQEKQPQERQPQEKQPQERQPQETSVYKPKEEKKNKKESLRTFVGAMIVLVVVVILIYSLLTYILN